MASSLRAHYLAVADASPLPVMIYNMPGNAAGIDLDAETVITLSAHPNIIGMKDSSGNVAKLAEVVADARERIRRAGGQRGFSVARAGGGRARRDCGAGQHCSTRMSAV